MQQAIDAVFDARIGDISGRGKLAADMREIWLMQPRFERRTPSTAAGLIAQPRFRAGFDFLRLRADAGEVDESLAGWWEDYSLADDTERGDLLDQARQEDQARRSSGAAATGGNSLSASTGAAGAPARKRRRRRKPQGGAATGEGGSGASASGDAGPDA